MSWILYGATGATGRLIAEVAVRRGHRPVLAGRHPGLLRPLAERLDLPWHAVDLADGDGLTNLVRSAPLTLLAAGPFDITSARVAKACLAAGVHYLDLANEVPVLEAIYGLDEAARARGVVMMPGVGFGTVAADTLARHVADRLPAADVLDVTIDLYTAGSSPGAQSNALRVLAMGGLVRRDGHLHPVVLGSRTPGAVVPPGARAVVAVPSGELAAIARTTGIANISVSRPVALPPLLARAVLPALPVLARSPALQRWAAERSSIGRPNPDAARRSRVWARAADRDGGTATAVLETGEGYTFTAESAVAAVEAVLATPLPGAHSPAGLLGPDFVLDIPGTSRSDAVPVGV